MWELQARLLRAPRVSYTAPMKTSLDLPTEAAVTIAALTAGPGLDRVGAEGRRLEQRGAAASLLREAAYVASLFCGFPRGVAALVALQDLANPEVESLAPPADRWISRVSRGHGSRIVKDRH